MSKAGEFKVTEALAKDVGRGIARMDPEDMRALGAEAGDIIQIRGRKITAARLMPAHKEYRGGRLLQIDGITRENAGAALGEKATAGKISGQNALSVTLSAANDTGTLPEPQYIRRLLEGMVAVKGDKIRVNFFGLKNQEFTVLETTPEPAVLITAGTRLKLKEGKSRETGGPPVSYEDIGGLSRELQKIRETIELPLRYPEIFERLGIEPPKGILLTGPPGTGKTLIARAVACETDAYFIHINGPEIIHKYYGESEASLREIFEKAAQHRQSIIFLDEIDAIAPKREEVTGEVEKRVVAQLLALMDGLQSRGQVIVIGATNLPNSLDPALRRPGRFDRELKIGVPDKKGRLEILQIHTRGMPLAADVELNKIAEVTHGFVGADMQALCKEAAMCCLREHFPEIDFGAGRLPPELLLKMSVSMNNFRDALKEVEPSATREFLIEVPDVGWDDIGGLAEIKQELQKAVEWPLKYPALFEIADISPPKGILLYGPPGTGKTLLAKAVANENSANFIAVKGPALLSKWVGESEKAVREIFKKARQAAPCIIFFDEIDALVPVRGSGQDHVTERVISQLLTEIDGIEELRQVVLLAATNRMDIIDPALLRPGRFDLHLELPLPDAETRLAILKVHARNKPLTRDVDLPHLARLTEGFSGADIRHLCQQAALQAMREFLREENKDFNCFQINCAHFQEALNKRGGRE